MSGVTYNHPVVSKHRLTHRNSVIIHVYISTELTVSVCVSLYRTTVVHNLQSDVLEDHHDVPISYVSACDTGCCAEADLTAERQADKDSSATQYKMSQYMKTGSSAEHGHVMDDLGTGRKSSIIQQTGNYRDVRVETKHSVDDSEDGRPVASVSDSDSWSAESDWTWSVSSLTSRDKQPVLSHLQSASDPFANIVPDADVVEVLDDAPALDVTETSTASGGFGQLGRGSVSWQKGMSDTSEVDTDRMMRNMASDRCQNTATESRCGRGRGLMNFRQLQAAKTASLRRPGSEESAGDSAAKCDMHQSADNKDAQTTSSVQSSMPDGIMEPASLPSTCPLPVTSYHPQMMPFGWLPPPPPLCGIPPPGFASAAVPIVGQTVPVPYSSFPLYPPYGYPMMPGSWPMIPSTFGSLPADEYNDSVDKVD